MHRVLLLSVFAFALLAQNPNAAKFPGAVATDQDLLVAKDQSASTLSAAIGAADTALPVADGTKFTAYEVVTIDAEQILVCSVASNTLNVCPGGRGFAGTTAASHASGASVRAHITAWHHNQVAAEMKAVQNQLGANLANVVKTGTAYGDPSWVSSLAGSKITGGISGAAGGAPWSGITSPPLALASITPNGRIRAVDVGCGALWDAFPCDNNFNGITDQADIAAALAANGANCPAGQAPLGVDAAGNAEGCYDPSTFRASQINFVYGGSASAFVDAVTVNNVWRAHAHAATVAEVACWTDAGTVSLTLRRSDGTNMHAALSCSSAGASTTTITTPSIGYGQGLGFVTAAVSGVKNLSVSVKYTRSY